MRELISDSGSIVAVWVTNKVKWQNFVKSELFPLWGVEYLATWYWLKVGDACVHAKQKFVSGHNVESDLARFCYPGH
jgi:hypothetical protein